MKKLICLLILVFLLPLSGCATSRYVHYPSKTQEEFNRDVYDCSNISGAGSYTSNGNPFLQAMEYDRCMKMKYGYVLERQK